MCVFNDHVNSVNKLRSVHETTTNE